MGYQRIDSPASVLSSTFALLSTFDVRRYGAAMDGVTDDTAAFQAALDAAAAAGGGTVSVPRGSAVIDGGLAWPVNKIIRMVGQGTSASGGLYATRLARTSGSAPIITATGTGQGANERVLVELQDIAFTGGDRPAQVILIQRGSQCYLNNIRISNNNGASGLEFQEVWDSRMHNVYVQTCGASGTTPAVLLTSYAGVVGAAAVTDGVHITNLTIHSSYGPDLRISGDTGQSYPSSNIQIANLNLEGKGAGTLGSPDTYSYIDLAYAQNCVFSNVRISIPTGRAPSTVITQSSGASGTRANQINNLVISVAGSNSPAIFVQQTAGTLMLNNVSITGQSTNTVFNVTSSVAAGRFKLSNLSHGASNVTSGFLADGRTIPEQIGRGVIPVAPLASTNAPTQSGDITVIPLNDGATEYIRAQVPIPADADPVGKVWLGIHWMASATGNALFRWEGKTMKAGDDPTSAVTTKDLTAAAHATSGRVQYSEFPANSGFTCSPGGTMLIKLSRVGGDALDTLAATANIVAIQMMYSRNF